MSVPNTTPDAPTPNTDLSMAFLDILDNANGGRKANRRRHDLCAIKRKLRANDGGEIEAATFLPNERDRMRRWIDARQGEKNLYVTANQALDGKAINWRLSKDDVGYIRAIYADLDPKKIKEGDASGEFFKKERVRLFALAKQMIGDAVCPPSLIVDSGGGMQAWWILSEPIPATPDNVALAEGIGRTLKGRFGGDSVFDVCRLMRLPGTINLPDASKIAQGRGPALATIEPQFVSNKTYNIERATASISPDRLSTRSSSRRQSPARSSISRTMRGDRTSGGVARMRGSSARKKRCPCRTAMPRSSRKARI